MIVRIARVKVGYRQAVIKLSPLRILSGLFAFAVGVSLVLPSLPG
jgi:hypothetical protein